MSKIFDALKKADHLRDSGVMDPVLDETNPQHTSVASTIAASAEDIPSPIFEETIPQESIQQESYPQESRRDDSPARVGSIKVSALSPVFPFEDLNSQAAEQYRIVRTKILHHPKHPKVIVVSSATSGDGKTVTAINLAAVLGLKQDVQVLLVDADLRRRDIHKVMGLPAQPGLGEVLSGTCPLDQALIQLKERPNLWVLPAGAAVQNPAELLESPRWRALMEVCRERFAYVIVDATPVAVVTDFELVQVACDGVILIVRPDHTGRKACMKALETVSKDKLIGTILNGVEEWFLWRPQGYGYYYGSEA